MTDTNETVETVELNDADLFNFADVSDLPEDMQSRMISSAVADSIAGYVDILKKASARNFKSLNVNQIMAVKIRMGGEVPTQTTVRNHLNKAIASGMIVKPSNQSYGLPENFPELVGKQVEEAKAADTADEAFEEGLGADDLDGLE